MFSILLKLIGTVLFLAFTFCSALNQSPTPSDPRYYTRQAVEAYQKKDYQSYLTNLEEAHKLRPNQPIFMYNLATAHALLGQRAEALRWLNRVADMGMFYRAAENPDFESMKNSEEFKAILKRFEANRAPANHSSLAFIVNEKGLVPESIAFDPRTVSYYISSVRKRKILRVDKSGTVTEFATAKEGLWAAMGMKVDKRFLWVATTAVSQMENSKREEEGWSGILKFDLASGKPVKKYLLSNQPHKHWLGDLAIDSRGHVFATDSLTPAIYVIKPDRDELELFLDRGPFVSPQGLAFSQDDRNIFVADYSLGVFLVNKRTKTWNQLASATAAALIGIDGLYCYRNNLIGIQNGTNPHRVVRMPLSKTLDRIEKVEVLEANNPQFDEPTLGVIANGWFYYIATSQWGKINDAGSFASPDSMREITVLKVKLDP